MKQVGVMCGVQAREKEKIEIIKRCVENLACHI